MPHKTRKRAEVLEGAPLRYAPENEQGVVFLFSHLARKWRLRVDLIRTGFPDCIAYQKADRGEKKIRIEFEFRSRNFKTQRHPARGCDWLVCWEHNWPSAPKHLRVVELRKEYGLGFNVWILPVWPRHVDDLWKLNREWGWSVPPRASEGDLLIYYHTHPERCIRQIFRHVGNVKYGPARYRRRFDYFGEIQRVCRLRAPIFLEDLQRDRILGTAGFVRGQLQGRPNVTEYWPYLYDMIVRRNPSVKRRLAKYAPDRLA